jgi:hypothetical protein
MMSQYTAFFTKWLLLLVCLFVPYQVLEARSWTVYLYLQATDSSQEAYQALGQIGDALKDDLEGSLIVHVDLQLPHAVERLTFAGGIIESTVLTISGHVSDLIQEGIIGAFGQAGEGETACIISGHGTGILTPTFDTDRQRWVYEPDEGPSPMKRYIGKRTAEFGRRIEHILFGKSMLSAQMGTSFLSAQELHKILAMAAKAVGRKVDLVGFDSCYMAMLEIAYQIKDSARYMLASQDCEEKDGWNYAHLFKAMRISSAREVGRRVVYEYERDRSARGYDRYSLSLCDLTYLDTFVEILDTFVAKVCVTHALEEALCAVRVSLHPVTGLPFYVDVKEFFEALYEELLTYASTQEIESIKQTLLDGRKALGMLVCASVTGSACKPLHGCSIYYPLAHIDSSYTGLFSQDHLWNKFLYYSTTDTSLRCRLDL